MFEYLMPLLVMPTYDRTLLDETYRAVVRPADRVRPRARRAVGRLGVGVQQDRRAAELPVPRVRRPGLGFKRGLADDLVVAPYASAHGADGRPGGGVREPPAAGRRGAARARTASTRRSTTRPRGCRAGRRASPSARSWPTTRAWRPSLAYLLLDRPMQRRFDVRPGVPGDRPAAPGARAQDAERSTRIRPKCPAAARHAGRGGRATTASSPTPEHAAPRKCTCSPTAATTWRSPRRAADTAAGATWPSPAGAKTRRATAGERSATSATSRRGEFWSTAHQPTLKQADELRGDLHPGPGRVPPPRRRHRHARRDQRLARGRHRAAADQHDQPRPSRRGRSS